MKHCAQFDKSYKCKVAIDKKMVAKSKAHADQIKIDKFQCVCDAEDDATECDYYFAKMIEQENPKTNSHECSNCGDHDDNARLCHTCYVNTLI